MIKTPRFLIALSSLLCLGATLTQAATTIEDFSSYTPNAPITSPWVTPQADDGTTRIARVLEDEDNIFGEGASNQYFKFASNRTAAGTYLISYRNFSGGYGSTGQVDLQIYDPNTSAGTTSQYGFQIRLSSNAGSPSNGDSPFWLVLHQGNIYDTDAKTLIGSYDVETVLNLSIVFNNTGTSITYGDSITLAASSYDLWINGEIVAHGTRRSTGGTLGRELQSIAFNAPASTSAVEEMYINQIKVSDIISIPEPAAAACALALLGLGLAVRRRRA